MPLHESVLTEALVDLLYELLPASGAPITFGTVAASAGLADAWQRTDGQSKKPRIRGLVLVVIQRKMLPSFLEKVIAAALGYRNAKKNPLTHAEVARLNELAEQLGQPVPALREPRFLAALAGAPPQQPLTPVTQRGSGVQPVAGQVQLDDDGVARATAHRIDELKALFLRLHVEADRQAAGQAFNGLLTDLFATFSLEPSQPFRVTGEEIDGALYFHNETYLIEAKWTAAKTSAQALYAFNEKIRRKSDFTRGIFISINGYTNEALEAYRTGAASRAVLLDGAHLMRVLDRAIGLPELLARVTRELTQRGSVYLPVSEL
jgi:hypothetical protein